MFAIFLRGVAAIAVVQAAPIALLRSYTRLNSDAEICQGDGKRNTGTLESAPIPWHDRPHFMAITLPLLACLVFERAG